MWKFAVSGVTRLFVVPAWWFLYLTSCAQLNIPLYGHDRFLRYVLVDYFFKCLLDLLFISVIFRLLSCLSHFNSESFFLDVFLLGMPFFCTYFRLHLLVEACLPLVPCSRWCRNLAISSLIRVNSRPFSETVASGGMELVMIGWWSPS